MKISQQTEINQDPKQRGYRFWLIRFVILLSLPILFYYGYCWGVWGRGSLLLQYLFQCNCPSASEEARYPDNVDVIVPACHHVGSRLSPSGRLLYVREKKLLYTSKYLLDLQMNEKTPFTIQDSNLYFLTDDLLYAPALYGGTELIVNRITGDNFSIQRLRYLRPDAFTNGDVNLGLLAEFLRGAEDVFLIDDYDTVVALASDPLANLEVNFVTDRFDISGFSSDRMEQFLRENNIIYHTAPADFLVEAVSPSGRFVARADGIYLIETGQKIVDSYTARGLFHQYSGKNFSVRGWVYDGTGVIYSRILNPCLIETNFFAFDDVGCFFKVPQPVIILKVPKEYLLPTETP